MGEVVEDAEVIKVTSSVYLDIFCGQSVARCGGYGCVLALGWLMRRTTLRFGKGFRVALGNRRAQAASMVIEPGDCEGGPDNRHRGADQWLFVVSGRGSATVNGRRIPLRESALLLIEKGDTHEIRNTGRTLLKALTLYVPPAYTKSGDELPRGRK